VAGSFEYLSNELLKKDIKMGEVEFSDEIKRVFYLIYDNDQANLRLVAIELENRGLSYIE